MWYRQMQLPKYPLFRTFLLQPVKVMIGLCWKLYFVVSVFACFALHSVNCISLVTMGTWPDRHMCKECAKKVRGNFLDPEKCRNTETHFSTEYTKDAPHPPVSKFYLWVTSKKLKLTAMLLQTRRCTQRSSCTSRFTRRFPPRCLKSR